MIVTAAKKGSPSLDPKGKRSAGQYIVTLASRIDPTFTTEVYKDVFDLRTLCSTYWYEAEAVATAELLKKYSPPGTILVLIDDRASRIFDVPNVPVGRPCHEDGLLFYTVPSLWWGPDASAIGGLFVKLRRDYEKAIGVVA